jgi:hypothetical protein
MIDTYTSATGFIFRASGTSTSLGHMPFDTLKLVTCEGATEDQQSFLRYYAEEYVPGELFNRLKTIVVLGPPRDYTHEVTLHACGNPDHNQFADIGPRKTVRVVGLEEAVAVVKAYQDRHNMGMGNCAKKHGEVWELSEPARRERVWILPSPKSWKRKKVGRVVYGGSFWDLQKIKEYEGAIRRFVDKTQA